MNRLRNIRYPILGIYDGGGWISTQYKNPYDKVGLWGQVISGIGTMMGGTSAYSSGMDKTDYGETSLMGALGSAFSSLNAGGISGSSKGTDTAKGTSFDASKLPGYSSAAYGGYQPHRFDGGGFDFSKGFSASGLNLGKGSGSGMDWASGITTAVGDTMLNFSDSTKIDTSAINGAKAVAKTKADQEIKSNSFDSLMEDAAHNFNLRTDYSKDEFQGTPTWKKLLTGHLQSANTGFNTMQSTGNWIAGVVAAAAGNTANDIGTYLANKNSKEQANTANRIGFGLNMLGNQRVSSEANYLTDIYNYNKAKNYTGSAEGGFIQTRKKTVGINDIEISSIQDGQELDGLSQADIKRLKKLGYEFDIIG